MGGNNKEGAKKDAAKVVKGEGFDFGVLKIVAGLLNDTDLPDEPINLVKVKEEKLVADFILAMESLEEGITPPKECEDLYGAYVDYVDDQAMVIKFELPEELKPKEEKEEKVVEKKKVPAKKKVASKKKTSAKKKAVAKKKTAAKKVEKKKAAPKKKAPVKKKAVAKKKIVSKKDNIDSFGFRIGSDRAKFMDVLLNASKKKEKGITIKEIKQLSWNKSKKTFGPICKQLKEKGLVDKNNNDKIFLTEKGLKLINK